MTVYNRQKQLELQEVTARYANYKSLRQQLISQKMIEVEEEMERATLEFGTYLQGMVTRTELPYKITVSDLGRAMGTSNRGTVYKFLGDAESRKQPRYFGETNLTVIGLELVKTEHLYGANQSDIYEAIVLDRADDSTWLATLQNLKNRYTIYQIDERGETIFNEWAGKKFPRPLADTAPEWLKWLDEQDEWLQKLEEK